VRRLRIGDIGEFGLIATLRSMLEGQGNELVRGVGDDAAVFRSHGGDLWSFTTDALVEGVHFDPVYTPWHALGYRTLAANLSDLAAMGGSSLSFALVALGLRAEVEVEQIEEMYRGMVDCGKEHACLVVGGDIVRSPGPMFVSVSVVGSIPGDRFLGRDGARTGQVVMVTGQLGDSYLGLKWLMEGRDKENYCAKKHLYPCPRLEEGRLASALGATAAIDVSDGLLRDLGHICEESGVGAEVVVDSIPLSPFALETASQLGEDAMQAALHGGEDFELILVADPRDAPMIREELEVTTVGKIVSGSGVRVVDSSGQQVHLEKSGYEHFKEG
jgi:thiamine-monophosphate kinase